MDKNYRLHIEGFINTFISNDRRSRWKTILSMKPKHWKKLSPWDLWDKRYSVLEYCSEWEKSIDELLVSTFFEQYTKKECVVIHLGHSEGRVETLTLLEALIGEKALFEGIISIIPCKLALAINHDGGICVCKVD